MCRFSVLQWNTLHKPSSNVSISFNHGIFATKCLEHKANLFIIAKQETSETTWKNIIFLVTNTDIKVNFSFFIKHCKVSSYNLFWKSYSRQKNSYFLVNSIALVLESKYFGCICHGKLGIGILTAIATSAFKYKNINILYKNINVLLF